MNADMLNTTVLQIGIGLRDARRARKMTLADVAQRSGMSESSLSRIERGNTALSVTTLLQLCHILKISLDTLVGDVAKDESAKVQVSRVDDRSHKIAASGYNWLLLGGNEPLSAFKAFHLIFPENETMRTLVSHTGQEYCYVLDGEINFYVGSEVYALKKGDSIMLESSLPHRAERTSKDDAHMLMIIASNDEDNAALEWWKLKPDE